MPSRRFRVPHTLVLLFAMIVAAVLLTYVLPAGSFDRVENERGRQQVVPGSYHLTPEHPRPSPVLVFTAIPRGLEAAAEIIFLIFIVGGAFAVLRRTGAVDALLGAALRGFGDKPLLLMAGGVTIFAVGSSTIGMAEEYLPFVPVLVALALALRYDAVVGVGILTVGYAIGYGTAAINPFTVLIAQDVAGVQPGSGLWFRVMLTALFLVVGVHHVWRYALRVQRAPAESLVADVPPPLVGSPHEAPAITRSHVLVLLTAVASLGLLVWVSARAAGTWSR